jgi:glycosyltransferase involved in cell wall biosynthesis
VTGGAAQATFEIHQRLRDAGHKSVLAVMRKESSDCDVVQLPVKSVWNCGWAERFERGLALLLGAKRELCLRGSFNRNVAPVLDIEPALARLPKPDVVFIYWISGMLTAADIRRLYERVMCPLVWVMPDMEPLSGGCHYSGGCKKFQSRCEHCPQLVRSGSYDLAYRTWCAKHRNLSSGIPLSFITASQWALERLRESSLFGHCRADKILAPMNSYMRPFSKGIARDVLGLPQSAKIILIGSQKLHDPRKGMDLLLMAAHALDSREVLDRAEIQKEDVLFLVMGKGADSLCAKLPFASRDLGFVSSQVELALAYQAADLFACPSLEDGGPMMISQSMLCGTPVVAFNMGIAPDLIRSEENGYIAQIGDVRDFVRGLEWVLTNSSIAGKQAAEWAAVQHSPDRIVRAYENLVAELVTNYKEGCVV